MEETSTPRRYHPKAGRRHHKSEQRDTPTSTPQTKTPTTKKGWEFSTAEDIPEVKPPEGIAPQTGESSAEEIRRAEEETQLSAEVASAPVYHSLMPHLGELEKTGFRLPNLQGDEIDLSLLSSRLSVNVKEEDVEWIPEQLFVQVMSDIEHEKERAHGGCGD